MRNRLVILYAFRMLRSDTFNPAIRVKNAPEGRVDVEVMGTLRIVLET